jgi:UDP-glucuronate decarboxylase
MHEFFSNKTVLVTGAAGFIGSHLCETLLAAGARVYGIDNFLTGRSENTASFAHHPNFTFIEADVIKKPTEYLPKELQIDVLLHFASPASPPRYQAHPIETYLVNTVALHNLLQYLQENSPQARTLFASTSEVYGDPQVHPQPESYWGNVNPNGIRSCYDEAKRLGETICGVHQRDFKMDVRIVRIFNTYGPRINPTDGRVIPQFISEALASKPYTIHGDGTQTRSYCYVSDLVDGILLLAAHQDGNGTTVNLGNPEEYTIKQTAEVIHQIMHPDTELKINTLPLPKDDPTRRKPDISYAQQLLGWQPKVSFTEGLSKTIEFFK